MDGFKLTGVVIVRGVLRLVNDCRQLVGTFDLRLSFDSTSYSCLLALNFLKGEMTVN